MSRLGAKGRRPTGEQLLVALMVLHVLVKLALFSRTASADVVGDERFYLDGGRALSNLVRDLVALGPIDTAELQRNAVGSGWFMPGMSLVLTPLFLVDPDASMPMIRGYLGVVSSGMLLLAVAQVRRVLGARVAAVLMVFPGLVPTWLVFSFAAWGDLTAGILVLVLVTQLVTLARGLREGSPPGLGAAARLGLVAIAVVYFRSSAMILALGLVVVLLVFAMLTLRGRARRRGVLAFAVTGAVFGSLLLPWSVAVSTALGAPVLTTTTVPTVMANTFGDREELCFGPCDPNSSIWFSPVRYARETARATGHSEVEVLQQMSDQAMTEVTPRSYARDVLGNFANYLREPAHFLDFVRSPGVESGDPGERVLRWLTNLMFFPVLAAALVGFLGVWRGPVERQILSVITKLGIGALLVQPFVHIAGGRYWTTAAPLFALAAVLLGRTYAVCSPMFMESTTGVDRPAMLTWLHVAQTVLVASTVLASVGLVVLAMA